MIICLWVYTKQAAAPERIDGELRILIQPSVIRFLCADVLFLEFYHIYTVFFLFQFYVLAVIQIFTDSIKKITSPFRLE